MGGGARREGGGEEERWTGAGGMDGLREEDRKRAKENVRQVKQGCAEFSRRPGATPAVERLAGKFRAFAQGLFDCRVSGPFLAFCRQTEQRDEGGE